MAVSALAVSVLLFISLLTSPTDADSEGYTVTIITSPQQGPFKFNEMVNFSCVVEPSPPDNVTFQWRAMEHVYGGSYFTGQNFTQYYSTYNLLYCWYFCEMRLNQTLLGSASRMVEVHDTPSVNLTIHQSVLREGESTLIECTVIGDRLREAINMSLWRNNELLSRVIGDHLSYSTDPYPFGAYTCAVGDIYSNVSILREKVQLQLLFDKTYCEQLRDEKRSVKASINNVFVTSCPTCANVLIENLQLNCTGTGQLVYVTADLVYSDPAGRITASTLLDMLQTWMLSQDSPSLMVNGTRVALNKQCLPQLNPVTRNACIDLETTHKDDINAANVRDMVVDNSGESVSFPSLIIGGFFGGIVAGIIIMAMLCGLIICIRQLKSMKAEVSLTESDKVADFPMNTNQAYETVDIRDEAARKGTAHEEPIYEMPTVS